MSVMYVRDLMTRDVVSAQPGDSLARLRDLVGLVSQRDLLRNHLIEQADVPDFIEDALLERLLVREVMTTGVVSVEPDSDIREAAQIMFENKYGCLPVVEGTRLVGIITESDFVRLMAGGH